MFPYGRAITSLVIPAPPRSRSVPVEYFILTGVSLKGDIVGTVDGRPVLEFAIDEVGKRYRFVGVAPRLPGGRYDVLALKQGEWIVEPGLVYAAES